VHVTPACVGSSEGSDHFECTKPSPAFLQEAVSRTSWSQGNSFTAAPGLPFKGKYMYAQEKETDLAIQRTNANNANTEMEHILITRNWYKK
jgi:hypothetical protein